MQPETQKPFSMSQFGFNRTGLTPDQYQGVLDAQKTVEEAKLKAGAAGKKPVSTLSSAEGEKKMQEVINTVSPPKTEGEAKSEATPPSATEQAEASLLQKEADAQKTESEKEAEKQKAGIKAVLDPLKAEADVSQRAQLDEIERQYGLLIAKQEEINRRSEKTSETIQLRTGTARYAPEAAMGAVNAVVAEGQSKLSELYNKKTSARANVVAAYNEKKYTLAFREFEAFQSIDKELRNETKEINKKLLEANKKADEARIQASRDAAVASLMEQGVTDPAKMLNLLNFDESGKRTGDFTAEEIAKAVKNLTPELKNKTDDGLGVELKQFEWAIKNPTISGIPATTTWKDYVRIMSDSKREDKRVGQGNGEGGDIGDFLFVLSGLPTRMKDSDAEKQFLRTYFDDAKVRGLTPFGMIDELTGYRVDSPSAFSEGMRNFMLTQDLAPERIAEIGRLINKGQYADAIKKVEDAAYLKALAIDRDNFTSEQAAIYAVKQVDEILKTLGEGFTDNIGPVEGLLLNKALGKLRPKDATELMQKITQLTAKFQKSQAGTAMTESEYSRIISPIVPSTTDKAGAFLEKLNGIKSNALRELNAVRASQELPVINERELLNRNLRVPAYSSLTGAQVSPMSASSAQTVNVLGQDMEVGSTVTGKNGKKGRVEADGTITPLE